jgi:hypothetical protein
MLFNKGTPLSDLWLPVCINGDMAAMRGIMKEMLSEEVAPIRIARACTATYFPEANVLVSINNSADRSNTPASKSIVISIEPSTDTAAAVDQIRREARL